MEWNEQMFAWNNLFTIEIMLSQIPGKCVIFKNLWKNGQPWKASNRIKKRLVKFWFLYYNTIFYYFTFFLNIIDFTTGQWTYQIIRWYQRR